MPILIHAVPNALVLRPGVMSWLSVRDPPSGLRPASVLEMWMRDTDATLLHTTREQSPARWITPAFAEMDFNELMA